MQCFLRTQEPVQVNHENNVCSKCESEIQPLKQHHIEAYPEVLILHLKRFKTVFQGRGQEALQQYLRHRVVCEETIHLNGVPYHQVARVYHIGESLRSGYYSTIR